MIYEAYLHQYFDVTNNKHFWNGSNQMPFGFDTTGVTHNGRITKEGIAKMIETKNKPIIINGLITSSAKENAKSAARTMKKKDENGLSIYEKAAIKGQKTKNKTFTKNGIETNLLIEQGKKSSKTKNSKEWKETKGKEMRKKLSNSKLKKSKKYNIIKNNKILLTNVTSKDLCKISPSLIKKNKKDFLGKSYQSRNTLANKKYEGLYAEITLCEDFYEGNIIKELDYLLN